MVGRHMTDEPSLKEVYSKFGEVSEAAQLLETELGNLLLVHKGAEAGLFETKRSRSGERSLNKLIETHLDNCSGNCAVTITS